MEEVQLYLTTTNEKLNTFVVVFFTNIITTALCIVIFQSYHVEHIKSVLKKAKLNSPNFTALSLTGYGQIVCGMRYLHIRGWIVHYQYGDISCSQGTNTEIEVSGFYYV